MPMVTLSLRLLVFGFCLPALSMPLEGSELCPCINASDDAYGRGCRAHDTSGDRFSECNSTLAPQWCSDMWCYVDPANCLATNQVSNIDNRLSWSYTTCGYRDLFSLSNITESIRGQTLRGVFIGNTGGWKGNYCSKGQICVNRGNGPTQRIFDLLSASAGFMLDQQMSIPQAAIEQMERANPSGSQFDLCTWATGMGFLDICVCSMLLVPRRTDATHFVTLWTESTILVGPLSSVQPRDDFASMLGRAFRPFSPMLWLTAVGAAMLLSMVILLFEKSEGGQFHQTEHGESIGDGLFNAFFGLVTFEVKFEPKTVGGRIVSLGLAFMFILLVCGYTASLASFLVVENRFTSPVSGLNDVIRLNYKVCAHRSDSEQVLLNGVSEQNLVVMQSRSDILPGVGPSCQVAVLREEDFEASQAANRGSFCDLQKIGDPLFSSIIGLAVSERWMRPLSYALARAGSSGEVQRSLDAYRPHNYCSAIAAKAEASAEPPALQVEGMLGPFVLTSLISGFGIVAHYLKYGWDREREKRRTRMSRSVESGQTSEAKVDEALEEDVDVESRPPHDMKNMSVESATRGRF